MVAYLRHQRHVVWLIAALCFGLPALAIAWLGPDIQAMLPKDATPQQVWAVYAQAFRPMIKWYLLIYLISLVGQMMIWAIWLAPPGQRIGDLMRRGVALAPSFLVVSLITGVAMGLGFAALIIPGIYLLGRLSIAGPVMAITGDANPINVVQKTWAWSANNGWRIAAFVIAITIGLLIVLSVFSGVVGGLVSAVVTPDIARWILGPVNAVTTIITSLISCALVAAIARQLAPQTRTTTFE